MLNKLHIRLSFFCSLVIGAILFIMTGICLVLSENNIREKNYADFQNNAASFLSYIQDQTVLSQSWLSQMEYHYHISVDILDNGSPLLYGALAHSADEQRLFAQARNMASAEYHFDAGTSGSAGVFLQQISFPMAGEDGSDYYVCAASVPRKSGFLDVAILYPADRVRQQILRQRFLFGCGALAAWLLLTVLAWLFTGRMLRPILKNRENQMQFVASASHELRSPLTVILSSLSAARIAEPKEREHFYNAMEAEGHRMSRLISDMLILANSDNHSWSIHPVLTEPDTLLLQTYEKYEPQAEKCGLHFSVRLPDESVSPVRMDGERIHQALSVLIDNAFSYTPKGGRVELELSVFEKHLEFSVSDNGPGIADADKKKIFDRFYRADVSRNSREHFGLGLCIAKEIVQLHKGKLLVEDAPGGGAVFRIWLPAQKH